MHDLVEGTIIALSASNTEASMIGFGLLLLSASVFFTNLRNSVNLIWRSPRRTSETGSVWQRLLFSIANQLFSFLLSAGQCFRAVGFIVLQHFHPLHIAIDCRRSRHPFRSG